MEKLIKSYRGEFTNVKLYEKIADTKNNDGLSVYVVVLEKMEHNTKSNITEFMFGIKANAYKKFRQLVETLLF